MDGDYSGNVFGRIEGGIEEVKVGIVNEVGLGINQLDVLNLF